MRFALIPALLLAFQASAQEDAPIDQLGDASQAQLRRVLEFMQSHDEDHRRSAYEASRERGEEFRETYLELIEAAIKHHAGGFERVIERELGPRSPLEGLREAWDTWQEQATTARQHIQTDHAKARGKLDEMDGLFASASQSWQALQSVFPAPADHEALIDRLEAHAGALRELAHELNPDEISPTETIELTTIERELGLGKVLRDYLAVHEAAGRFMDKHRQANETNEQMTWAAPDQKTFAAILNQRRATVGLGPLILNENLSAACAAHSVEMEQLGYFAHESPVEENRTPVVRARKAGFDRFAGECIFMGRIAATDAEQAWWYSCGHRLINYGSGVSILGIARHNLHWTLNTGR